MNTALNTFNSIYLIIATAFIGFVTAVFYLGNTETFNAFKANLPFTFFQRMFLGIMLGVVSSLFLLIINWIYNRTLGSKKGIINLKSLSIKLLISTLVSSFVGAIIFFTIG